MANQAYAKVFEIIGGQLGQNPSVDRVVAKCCFVLP
jgi:hypothetical protein